MRRQNELGLGRPGDFREKLITRAPRCLFEIVAGPGRALLNIRTGDLCATTQPFGHGRDPARIGVTRRAAQFVIEMGDDDFNVELPGAHEFVEREQ